MRRRVVVALGATVLIGLLAGCTASNSSSGVSAGPVAPQRSDSAAGSNAPGKAGGTSGRAGAAPNMPSATTGRQVIRTATVAMTTNNVPNSASRAEQLAEGAGGYLSAENVDGDTATVTLSVPATQLDSVLLALANQVGKVTSQQQSSQDVTDQLVDVNSRIATQQASVDRVRQLLNQAQSISDIAQIEGELTSREADLESMEHQQAELAGQVAMSTVNVQLTRATPPPPVQASGPQPGFGSGISGGWHALGQTVRVLLLVLGAALPFLLGFGIPALVIWWFIRRRRTTKTS